MPSSMQAATISVPPCMKAVPGSQAVSWGTQLLAAQENWPTWFAGCTSAFLACQGLRVLIVSNIDWLDAGLCAARVSGQFQCMALPHTGHCLAEDAPARVAEMIVHAAARAALISYGVHHGDGVPSTAVPVVGTIAPAAWPGSARPV